MVQPNAVFKGTDQAAFNSKLRLGTDLGPLTIFDVITLQWVIIGTISPHVCSLIYSLSESVADPKVHTLVYTKVTECLIVIRVLARQQLPDNFMHLLQTAPIY